MYVCNGADEAYRLRICIRLGSCYVCSKNLSVEINLCQFKIGIITNIHLQRRNSGVFQNSYINCCSVLFIINLYILNSNRGFCSKSLLCIGSKTFTPKKSSRIFALTCIPCRGNIEGVFTHFNVCILG